MTTLPLQRPTTSEELAAAVAQAASAGHQVQILGSNSLPLARLDPARPVQPVSTLRLNKIREHAVPDMTVIADAGITLEALQRHLAWHNQWLPIDPPALAGRSPAQRTLGGLIASNSLGPLRLGFGDYRSLLLGLRWVDASGTLLKGGGRTVKNSAGYSTPRLLIGSSGALGAIAEVTLRTYARPADEQALIAFCDHPQQAEELLAAILESPVLPAWIELLGGQGFKDNPLQLPSSPLLLAVGFMDRPELCADQIATLRRLSPLAGSAIDSITQTAPQCGRLRLWLTTEPPGALAFRVYCHSSQVAALTAELQTLATAHHATAWLAAEAVAGIIRGSILPLPLHPLPPLGPDQVALLAQTIISQMQIHNAEVCFLPSDPLQRTSENPPDDLFTRLKTTLDPRAVFGLPPTVHNQNKPPPADMLQ